MPSLFYTAAFERRFPLPFLLFEDLEIRIEAAGGGAASAEQVEEAIRQCLARCTGLKKAAEDDIRYVAQRLEEAAKEAADLAEKEEDNVSKRGPKQTFASSFSDWVGDLEPHELCLVLSDFDYPRAETLYTKVDRSDVVLLSTQWMKKEWERIKVEYEAVVYGFGGGYEDKGSVGVDVDVSCDDNTQGQVISRAALDAVKF